MNVRNAQKRKKTTKIYTHNKATRYSPRERKIQESKLL